MPLDAQTRLLRVIDGSEPALNPKTGRRPNVRIIAATNRDLRGLIRAGPVPRGPVLPPERRAAAPAAAARPHRGHPGPGPRLPAARQPRGPAGQDHRRRRAGPAEAARLAGQCARAGEPDPPDLRPLRRGPDHRPHRRARAGRPAAGRARARRGRRPCPSSSSASSPATSPTSPTACRRPGLYDRVLEEVERPLIQLTLAATRGNQVRAAEILGLNRNTLRKKIHDLGVEMQRGRR